MDNGHMLKMMTKKAHQFIQGKLSSGKICDSLERIFFTVVSAVSTLSKLINFFDILKHFKILEDMKTGFTEKVTEKYCAAIVLTLERCSVRRVLSLR